MPEEGTVVKLGVFLIKVLNGSSGQLHSQAVFIHKSS
jgi:hypothetical protein